MGPGFIAEDRLGYQQITNVSAAVGLTVPAGTSMALIQVETQTVRWRDDGTNPTATVGMVLAPGSTLEYTGSSFGSIKFIEVAASATINISYYGTETV